jgi:GMC oxidoreductase
VRLETAVRWILFDGDFTFPFTLLWRFRGKKTPRARCVRLTSLETVCVKEGGRIFLAAGAFHTPELLIRSGIGPGGRVVDNKEVGENLSDKPGMLLLSNFVKSFDYSNQISLTSIAATKVNNTRSTLIFEEGSFGIPALTNLLVFERNFVPTSARNSLFAKLFIRLANFCSTDPGILLSLVKGALCKASAKVSYSENKLGTKKFWAPSCFLATGAVPHLIPKDMFDARSFAKSFPNTPCLGFYAQGEIGPLALAARKSVFQTGKACFFCRASLLCLPCSSSQK